MAAADTLTPFGIYGAYDLAIHKFVRDIVTQVEPTTIVVQASPQRAFGDAAAMVAKGLVDPTILPEADFNRSANIPLPLVSIQPSAPERRDGQRSLPARNLFRTTLPGTDPSMRERWVARPPLPLWLNYQVEVWTKTRSTMNALITALQQKFDPYIAWGDVVIDDWFWGTVWMPVHLNGITDNSELEAGDKDRLLRHTITLRVEGWCFYTPEKDFTVVKTTLDDLESHLEGLQFIDASRFSSIYLETPAKRLFQICVAHRGNLSVIPVETPPNPITHYYGMKTIVFRNGFVLDEIVSPIQTHAWSVTYSGDLDGKVLNLNRIYSGLTSLPPLFISGGQELLVGQSLIRSGGTFYTEIYLHRSLRLGYRARYLLDFNADPVAPPLPYSLTLPK